MTAISVQNGAQFCQDFPDDFQSMSSEMLTRCRIRLLQPLKLNFSDLKFCVKFFVFFPDESVFILTRLASSKSFFKFFFLFFYNKFGWCVAVFVNSYSRKFEYFILLTIAANCVVLMLEEPLPNGDTTDRNKQLVRDDLNICTNQRSH